MAPMNVGRVVVGGLVSGLVANILDFVITSYFLVTDIAEMAARLNLSATTAESAVWVFVGGDFVWGLLLVFTYAAIRPRFGPGPKTAAISGFILWLAIAILTAQLTAMGLRTLSSYLKSAALYLVSAILSSLAGAALYRE